MVHTYSPFLSGSSGPLDAALSGDSDCLHSRVSCWVYLDDNETKE
jgi:hypothetical protein